MCLHPILYKATQREELGKRLQGLLLISDENAVWQFFGADLVICDFLRQQPTGCRTYTCTAMTGRNHQPAITLRRVNNILTAVVATLAVYIACAPFLPQAEWWVAHESPVKGFLPGGSDAAATPAPGQVIEGDKLFIPRIDLAEPIHGGGKESLNLGVWRVPHTSTPDNGGNTVLIGHRFTYKDPTGVFYHLDKVQKGDNITVHWLGKAYEYRVTEIKVVPASEVSVEHNTTEPRLTIYTCTPLWSVENRLVVIAEPRGAGR